MRSHLRLIGRVLDASSMCKKKTMCAHTLKLYLLVEYRSNEVFIDEPETRCLVQQLYIAILAVFITVIWKNKKRCFHQHHVDVSGIYQRIGNSAAWYCIRREPRSNSSFHLLCIQKWIRAEFLDLKWQYDEMLVYSVYLSLLRGYSESVRPNVQACSFCAVPGLNPNMNVSSMDMTSGLSVKDTSQSQSRLPQWTHPNSMDSLANSSSPLDPGKQSKITFIDTLTVWISRFMGGGVVLHQNKLCLYKNIYRTSWDDYECIV